MKIAGANPARAILNIIMCGIIGYTGSKNATPVLLQGLKLLEYRGYDSAGVAVLDHKLEIRKQVGRIQHLAEHIEEHPVAGNTGISHTRWATHGKVTTSNSHPHTNTSHTLAVVHNGVIENHQSLRAALELQGYCFKSQTDTEVIAHLLDHHIDLITQHCPIDAAVVTQALHQVLPQLHGTYAVGIVHEDLPGNIFGACKGSPLVLGIGDKENFLASDAGAIASHVHQVIYLKDNDIVHVQADAFDISNLDGSGYYEISHIDPCVMESSLGDHKHYMHKEIHEQPDAVRRAIQGRICWDHASVVMPEIDALNLENIKRVLLLGCGTAAHAAMIGKHYMEQIAGIPADVEFASEFRYRNAPLVDGLLVIAISQSGETADTLAAVHASKQQGYATMSICNHTSSSIARASDVCMPMLAGPEIGVAATKSFTSQCVMLLLLAIKLSQANNLDLIQHLQQLPQLIKETLQQEQHICDVAAKHANAKSMMFLGRQCNYPIALEGALKLKEISYIHASGHPSAELKHGVIALITPEVPSVFVAPADDLLAKNLSNIEEIRARGGPVIGIGPSCAALQQVCDDVLTIPDAMNHTTPLLANIVMQLFAYHAATYLRCDVDKPRNLAKSVTVE